MDSINLSGIDIAILIVYIIAIIWWGLRHGQSKDSTSYFLAGRNMTWPVIGLSLFAASISSSTLIGQSGDAYSTGIAVFNYNLISVIVMIFFAIFFLPFYIQSGIFTMPEFLERRFDARSRYYFSFITIIGNVFLDAAAALYAAALIIKLIIPEADLQIIIIIFAIFVASYTIPGGLSSAINVELVQAVILIIGSVILTWLISVHGGLEHLKELFASHDMMVRLVRPLSDPSVPWLGLVVGIPVLGFYFWCNNQTLVQRVLSARSVDEGRKGVLFVGFLTVLTLFFIVMPGIMAQKLFPGLPKPDMVYPKMVLNLMPVGLLGIMVSALIAALTSTLSAILNSASTLVTMDFYSKFRPKASSHHLVTVGRITSVIILVIAVLWAPQIGKFGSLVKYYQQMLSYIAPPIVTVFFIGLFWKRANSKGAFWGLIFGFIVAILMLFFKDDVFGNMHFLLVIPFLVAISLVMIVVISLLTTKPAPDKVKDYTWTPSLFIQETLAMKGMKWFVNYRFWAGLLLLFCLSMLFLFR